MLQPGELADQRGLVDAEVRRGGANGGVGHGGLEALQPELTDSSAGARQVTASLGLGLGLAMATAVGAPVRPANAMMDRLAVPVPGDDMLTPFLDRVPPVAQALPGRGLAGWPMATLPGKRPRFEPRTRC